MVGPTTPLTAPSCGCEGVVSEVVSFAAGLTGVCEFELLLFALSLTLFEFEFEFPLLPFEFALFPFEFAGPVTPADEALCV